MWSHTAHARQRARLVNYFTNTVRQFVRRLHPAQAVTPSATRRVKLEESLRIGERCLAKIVGEEIEVGPWILCEPKRPVRPVHKSLTTNHSKELRQVILGRAPHPREIPN